MRQSNFQQWQSRRHAPHSAEALMVVVVEYQSDGRSVERERVVLPRSPDRQTAAAAVAQARRSAG